MTTIEIDLPTADRWVTARDAARVGMTLPLVLAEQRHRHVVDEGAVLAMSRYDAYVTACDAEELEAFDVAMWEVHGRPYGPLPVTPEFRWAVVYGGSLTRVNAFLPAEYHVWGLAPVDGGVIIVGRDSAGWTLDGFVLPRLASGSIYGEEVVPVVV